MPSISGASLVYSSGATDSDVFNPLTRWIDAGLVKNARAVLKMESDTDYCQVTAAYQTCNDPQANPDTAAAFQILAGDPEADTDQVLTDEGVSYPNKWNDVSSSTNGKKHVRFGVLVRNDTANEDRQCCLASLKVDYKTE